MCLGTKSTSEKQSYPTCPTKDDHDDKKIRKQNVITAVACGILSPLLIAGGIGLIVWTAQTIHSSPPVTAYQIKGAAGGIFFGSASVVLGTVLGGMTIYWIKHRQKEEVQPS